MHASGIKAALSHQHLFSIGGVIGASEPVPTLAVSIADGATHALRQPASLQLARLHHTVTGLHAGPCALVVGGSFTAADGASRTAPPMLLSLTSTTPHPTLTTAIVQGSEAWPAISMHGSCAGAPSTVVVFGGELAGKLSSATHLVKEALDGSWSWTTLEEVSQALYIARSCISP